jgi:signal transduction histidine kinase
MSGLARRDGTPSELHERLSALEKENALARLELERLNAEREGMRDLHRATLNLLEDVDEERSKYYNAQRALLNLLEDADEERSRVEHTKARLELVNNELETFSSSVSHDLQAPLRAIKGLSQAVLEDQQDRLDEVGRRYLVLMRDSAIKMEILIEDVLEFSRLNRQSMMRSHIDLSSIARSTFAELYALEQGRNIALVTNGTPLVTGDEAMLRRVMSNLLSNSIKFTRDREDALIEFGFEPESGSYYVRDNGVGFDMQYADRLFDVFHRLHPGSEYKGTGMGLALVKRIIGRHGGRIWAVGDAGKGASFHFTLPDGNMGGGDPPRT